jgi:hypothetical protein
MHYISFSYLREVTLPCIRLLRGTSHDLTTRRPAALSCRDPSGRVYGKWEPVLSPREARPHPQHQHPNAAKMA